MATRAVVYYNGSDAVQMDLLQAIEYVRAFEGKASFDVGGLRVEYALLDAFEKMLTTRARN